MVDDQPFVIPTAYGRVGDKIYVHGSAGSRMLRALSTPINVCLTVTLLDGLVLARSALSHSMNYRSVVLFSQAEVVSGDHEKRQALKAFTDQIIPERWENIREPNQSELNQTLVLSLPLTEASAKIRSGPAKDSEEDYDWPVWAGEIPLSIVAGEPVDDPRLLLGIDIPSYVKNYNRSNPVQPLSDRR